MGQFHKAQAIYFSIFSVLRFFILFGSGQSGPTSYMACHVATPHQQRHLGLYAGYAMQMQVRCPFFPSLLYSFP